MLDTIEQQQEQIKALLAALPANNAACVDMTPPMSEDTIVRLRDDADRLPKHAAS